MHVNGRWILLLRRNSQILIAKLAGLHFQFLFHLQISGLYFVFANMRTPAIWLARSYKNALCSTAAFNLKISQRHISAWAVPLTH
jgi:hypothetical protein